MEQSSGADGFSVRFVWKVLSRSGYFWGGCFLFAFVLSNLGPLWIAAARGEHLIGTTTEGLLAFTLLFVLGGLWFFFDLYQIYGQIKLTTDERIRALLMDSAFRTARMFYVAATLSIFALLLCRMLMGNL